MAKKVDSSISPEIESFLKEPLQWPKYDQYPQLSYSVPHILSTEPSNRQLFPSHYS